jgi:hypothetical protein
LAHRNYYFEDEKDILNHKNYYFEEEKGIGTLR